MVKTKKINSVISKEEFNEMRLALDAVEGRVCRVEEMEWKREKKKLSVYDWAIIAYVILFVVYMFILILKQRREYVRS